MDPPRSLGIRLFTDQEYKMLGPIHGPLVFRNSHVVYAGSLGASLPHKSHPALLAAPVHVEAAGVDAHRGPAALVTAGLTATYLGMVYSGYI